MLLRYSQWREQQGVRCLAGRDLRAPDAPAGAAEQRSREKRHKEKELKEEKQS